MPGAERRERPGDGGDLGAAGRRVSQAPDSLARLSGACETEHDPPSGRYLAAAAACWAAASSASSAVIRANAGREQTRAMYAWIDRARHLAGGAGSLAEGATLSLIHI